VSLPSYQPGDALAYVKERGWSHKTSGQEIILHVCPLCGQEGEHFYLNNETGLFVDHRASCGRTGNFFQLCRELGDLPDGVRAFPKQTGVSTPKTSWPVSSIATYEEALATDVDAQEYLRGRGLTLKTAKDWHFGVKTDADGVRWLVMPYLIAGDRLADAKMRSLPPAPKAFRRTGKGESILYGEHLLDKTRPDNERLLILCEGEADCVTLYQYGYRAVSTSTGAGSFSPRWVDLIRDFNPTTLFVVYDTDPSGQTGAAKILKKFDDLRDVRNVVLPDSKDLNDFFLTHTKEEFDQLLADSKSAEVEHVITLPNALDALETKLFLGDSAFDGFPSQFAELNQLIAGGYWRGQLTTVSGVSGAGKTSLVLQEMWTFAKAGVPAFFCCLEVPAEMILRKLCEHEFRKPKLELTYTDVQKYRPLMERVPFYLGERAPSLKAFEKTVRGAVKRYDAQVIGFDNLNFFVRSLEHQNEELGQVTKLMKELAIDLNIVFFAVAQPRKFDSAERVIRGDDVKGSSSTVDDSDTLLLLYRKRVQTQAKDFGKNIGFVGNHSPYALLRVDKARFSSGGECYVYFDGAFSTFRALTPDEKQRLMGGRSDENWQDRQD
jgi:twinkle protein